MALILLGVAVFLGNPAACDPGDDFQYGERELKAAVEGTWSVAIEPAAGGAPVAFQVRLEQASGVAQAVRPGGGPFLSEAMACGNRTLVRSAGACISSTEMPLAGQVTDGDGSLRGQTVAGSLMVPSLIFTQGELWLRVGPHVMSGSLSSAGEASSLHTLNPTDRTIMTGDRVTMTRITR